MKFIFQTI